MNKEQDKKEHSRLSPSSGGSWIECLDYKSFDNVNKMAERGSLMHKIAKDILKGIDINEEDLKRIDAFDLKNIKYYVDIVKDLIKRGGDNHIEEGVYYNELIYGTPDFYRIKEDKLTILDYKTGYVNVKAKDNWQLVIYALSILKDNPKIKRIELGIVQGGKVEKALYRVGDLDYYKGVLDGKIEEFKNGKYKRNAGGYCMYCNNKIICSAYNTHIIDIINDLKKEILK